MRSAAEAGEPAATPDVPAGPKARAAAGPEAPAAAGPKAVPEPLPAPLAPATDGMPALAEGWRLVAGDSAPPPPPAPTTTPASPGLPLGVVRQIAAETQHRIAAAWAPQMASRNHRAPQVHGCVNCALPLSATARFCRRCGSQQG
jgi:ribosomal protein L40E